MTVTTISHEELRRVIMGTLLVGSMKVEHWKSIYDHVNGHTKAVFHMTPKEAKNVIDFYETNRRDRERPN